MWKPVRWKPMKISGCADHWFILMSKAARVLCRAGHWVLLHLYCVVGIGSLCSSSLFLAISIHLSFACLCVGETKENPLFSVLRKAGEVGWRGWSLVLLFCSWWGKLSHWEVPSWCWAVPLWGMGWCRQSCSSFPFCMVILIFFGPMYC